MGSSKPSITPQQAVLLRRGAAARKLIEEGHNPYEMLSLVVWPPDGLLEAEEEQELQRRLRSAA